MYIYDTGALIAIERNNRHLARRHDLALDARLTPVVPAAVLAQAWNGGARQAQLARVLRSCTIDPLTEDGAREVGRLRVAAGTTDVVDVSVVETAIRWRYTILTSDPDDITRIIDAAPTAVAMERI